MSNSIGAATTADDYHGAEMRSEFNRGWSSDVRNEMCCGNGDSQLSLKCAPWGSSGSLFVGSGVHVRSSLTQSSSLASEIEARQAHPSFLDPNNVPSASSSFDLYCQHEMAEKSYALERFRVNYGNCSSLASRSVDNIIVEILPDALAKEESHVNMLSTTKEQTIPLMHEIHASNGDEDFDALEEVDNYFYSFFACKLPFFVYSFLDIVLACSGKGIEDRLFFQMSDLFWKVRE